MSVITFYEYRLITLIVDSSTTNNNKYKKKKKTQVLYAILWQKFTRLYNIARL